MDLKALAVSAMSPGTGIPLAIKCVLGHRKRVLRIGGRREALHPPGPNLVFLHQTRHPVTANASSPQALVDPWAAAGVFTFAVDRFDFHDQF